NKNISTQLYVMIKTTVPPISKKRIASLLGNITPMPTLAMRQPNSALKKSPKPILCCPILNSVNNTISCAPWELVHDLPVLVQARNKAVSKISFRDSSARPAVDKVDSAISLADSAVVARASSTSSHQPKEPILKARSQSVLQTPFGVPLLMCPPVMVPPMRCVSRPESKMAKRCASKVKANRAPVDVAT